MLIHIKIITIRYDIQQPGKIIGRNFALFILRVLPANRYLKMFFNMSNNSFHVIIRKIRSGGEAQPIIKKLFA